MKILIVLSIGLLTFGCTHKNNGRNNLGADPYVDPNYAYSIAKSLTIQEPCNRSTEDAKAYAKFQRILSFCGFKSDGQKNETDTAHLSLRSTARCINTMIDFLPQDDIRGSLHDLIPRIGSDDECKKIILKASRSAVYNLIVNYASSIEKNSDPKDGAVLNRERLLSFFDLLNLWYSKLIERKDTKNIIDDQQYLNDLKDIYSSVWENVLSKTRTDEILKNNTHSAIGIDTNISILKMALEKDLHSYSLAILFGEVLKPIYERIKILTSLRDLVCKSSTCEPSQQSDVTLMMTFLAELPTLEKNEKMVISLTDMNPSLKEFIELCLKKNKKISEMFEDISVISSAGKIPIYETDLSLFKEEFWPILTIIKDAHGKMKNFSKTGFYAGSKIYESSFGFTKENKEAAYLDARSISKSLDTSVQNFQSERLALLNQILADNDINGTLARLEYELKKEEQEMIYLISDLNGIQHSLADKQQSFAKYEKSFMDAKNSTKWKDLYHNSNSLESKTTIQINAKDIEIFPKTDDNVHFDITPYAIKTKDANSSTFKLATNKGDFLNISVSGFWSPVCALQRSLYSQNQIKNTKTGPEGFELIFENNQSVVTSSSKYSGVEKYSGKSYSARACVGLNGMGIFSSNLVQACAESFSGKRNIETDGSGSTDSDSSASKSSFDVGLRLADTPFPNYPAGALLLIEVPKDKTLFSNITGIYTVSRDFSLLVKNDSDYYLMGNDCPSADETNNLVVTTEKYSPYLKEAEAAKEAMFRSLDLLKRQELSLLEAGQITAVDLAAIKSEVNANLNASGFKLSELPIIGELFTSWLDNEISILEKKMSIKLLSRKIDSGVMSLKSIEDSIKNINERKKINQVYKLWAVDNLDLDQLQDEFDRSVYKINNGIIPVISFYNRSLLQKLGPEISAIKNVTLTTPLADISKKIVTFVQKIDEGLKDASYSDVPESTFTISVYYPNPFIPRSTDGKPLQNQGCDLYLISSQPEEIAVAQTPALARTEEKIFSIQFLDGKPDIKELSIGPDEWEQSPLGDLKFNGKKTRLEKKQCSFVASVGGHNPVLSAKAQYPDYFNKYLYPTADLATASDIWKKLYSGSTKMITSVTPDQIYTKASVGKLRCQYSHPIIESMGIHFVYGNNNEQDKYNEIKFTVQANTVGPMVFPAQNDFEVYNLIKNSWRNFEIPVTFGSLYSAPSVFQNRIAKEQKDLGNGRSPFTNFVISDIPIVHYSSDSANTAFIDDIPLNEIEGVMVFFQVRPRKLDQSIESVSFCKEKRDEE